ncbi:carbohydrate kinase family protein [Aliterella atlantica]|uniref:Fructokinase n=1 Tax=Aliterella atlantica CENA595 TaxID=1618023 RepID=A0A0D8ZUB8_9CYAN|nr:carbohydrate kinase [Aliterella atlantica]KJH72054.1 fructokinase [Aliterella atlantica CENA595]
MSNPRVLCLGEILFDLLADQKGRSLAQVESWTPYPGGAPANVACALPKLGTSSGFIGCVGEDDAGNQLVEVLQTAAVDITGVQRCSAPTRQIYVERTETGDRIFAGFGDLNTSDFADTQLQAAQIPEKLFTTADFLVLGTIALAYPHSRQGVHRALELAEQYDVKVVLDANWRPVFWQQDFDSVKQIMQAAFKKIDFLKLSKEEAELLFDTSDPGAITYRLDLVEGVVITDGDRGCSYCLSENEGKLPAFSIPVVDTTGAGDSFVAGFVHQLCQLGISSLANPDTAKQVVNYANAAGALTTLKPGAIASQPTASEVEAFLRSPKLA